jgi:hypothetical protein
VKRAALLCVFMLATQASAQEPPWPRVPPRAPVQQASQARNDSPRLYAGAGVETVSGSEVTLNGRALQYERPSSYNFPPAAPIGVLRVDMPLHRLLLAGVQAGVMSWRTETERVMGRSPHYTFDLGAVARLRIGLGAYGRHELVGSVVVGPSFDVADEGPRGYGASIDAHVGVHAGGFAGYQYFPLSSPFGVFAEGGLTYHRLTQTIEYEIDGRGSRDELIYQPIQGFVRGGLMLVLFR